LDVGVLVDRPAPATGGGSSSNCAHWLYTALTGASTVMDFSTFVVIRHSYRSRLTLDVPVPSPA